MSMDEKKKALELAVSQIEKQFGKGSLMRLGADELVVAGEYPDEGDADFAITGGTGHRAGARGTVWLESGEIHVAGRPEHLPRRLRDWLIAQMRLQIEPLVLQKATRVERRVKRITLRDNRSRWGSCGPDGSMSFSWRLVFAPPVVLDYLVAHEVAHLVHHNHGDRFWALARELCDGSMDEAHAWLRRYGETLLQYGA